MLLTVVATVLHYSVALLTLCSTLFYTACVPMYAPQGKATVMHHNKRLLTDTDTVLHYYLLL
jgi:hypothetical protein